MAKLEEVMATGRLPRDGEAGTPQEGAQECLSEMSVPSSFATAGSSLSTARPSESAGAWSRRAGKGRKDETTGSTAAVAAVAVGPVGVSCLQMHFTSRQDSGKLPRGELELSLEEAEAYQSAFQMAGQSLRLEAAVEFDDTSSIVSSASEQDVSTRPSRSSSRVSVPNTRLGYKRVDWGSVGRQKAVLLDSEQSRPVMREKATGHDVPDARRTARDVSPSREEVPSSLLGEEALEASRELGSHIAGCTRSKTARRGQAPGHGVPDAKVRPLPGFGDSRRPARAVPQSHEEVPVSLLRGEGAGFAAGDVVSVREGFDQLERGLRGRLEKIDGDGDALVFFNGIGKEWVFKRNLHKLEKEEAPRLTLRALAGTWRGCDGAVWTVERSGRAHERGELRNELKDLTEHGSGSRMVIQRGDGWKIDMQRSTTAKLLWKKADEADLVWLKDVPKEVVPTSRQAPGHCIPGPMKRLLPGHRDGRRSARAAQASREKGRSHILGENAPTEVRAVGVRSVRAPSGKAVERRPENKLPLAVQEAPRHGVQEVKARPLPGRSDSGRPARTAPRPHEEVPPSLGEQALQEIRARVGSLTSGTEVGHRRKRRRVSARKFSPAVDKDALQAKLGKLREDQLGRVLEFLAPGLGSGLGSEEFVSLNLAALPPHRQRSLEQFVDDAISAGASLSVADLVKCQEGSAAALLSPASQGPHASANSLEITPGLRRKPDSDLQARQQRVWEECVARERQRQHHLRDAMSAWATPLQLSQE